MTTTAWKPGTIVGPTDYHDPARRIRFGVALAPEPSERVQRLLDADLGGWHPDEDEDYAARCDYCGTEFSLDKQVQLRWAYTYMTEAGKGLHTTGIYCSEPCASWSASRTGSSRG
jgi:hypothetical protein